MAANRRLRRSQTRYRHAIRRARNVIHPYAIAEFHGTRLPAMFAADADLEIRTSFAAELYRHLNHLPDTVLIEHGKRIRFEDFEIFVLPGKFRVVVARQTHRGL